jgi:hypothetical protein
MPIATLRSSWASVRSKGSSRSMVRPFEKPHGRLARRPSVPSPSRNHHDGLDRPLVPSIRLRTGSELVNGSAPRVAAVQAFKSSRTDSGGELPRFGNSRNVEMNSNISAAELNWRGQSALLAGIVLAGLFVYLFQTHPFEEFALNLEVIAITLGKVTEKAGPLRYSPRRRPMPEYRYLQDLVRS